jgi:hypothetical protein
MRTAALAALLLTLAGAPQAQDRSERVSDAVERPFPAAGIARLNLAAGDYRITGTKSNRIRVVWHTRTAAQLIDSRVKVTVRGSEAEILTSRPRDLGNSAFRVEVELPQRTDLHLRMTAGDLSIAGLEGNKDVLLRAGDLNIEVPEPERYRRVRASVTAGDLSARPFGFSTGGLFRSFQHEGAGRFELRARLWAGDLRILRTKPAE